MINSLKRQLTQLIDDFLEFKQRCLAEAELDSNRKRMNFNKCKNILNDEE